MKTLRQLVRLMADNDLTELDIEGEGDKVRLRRHGSGPDVQYVPTPPQAPAPSGAPTTRHADGGGHDGGAGDGAGGGGGGDRGTIQISSPMVGSYYSASSPDAKPFVTVGDRVEPDTVVCIIEAMKVFNEIKAEVSGTIDRVLVDNGQAVEFEQPLFEVKPD
ncbi:MAG: acetyl-CoA carboxylase biotin carboxyl carrier protein [Phycisphaeraceae bacterium]